MDLSTRQIANLIKIAKKNNISKLTVGEFSVEFKTEGENHAKKSKSSKKEIEEINQKGLLKDSLDAHEEDLSQLMVTDPLRYEELLEKELDNDEIGRA